MNPYYDPEKYGLEFVGEISWDDEPYQFDLTAVWKDSANNYYWADDAGCSCPSPFENIQPKDLSRGTAHELANYLQLYETEHEGVQVQIVDMISRIMI